MNSKHLSSCLEAILNDRQPQNLQAKLDEYINKIDQITEAESSKLHAVLYRIWESDLIQKEDDFDNHSLLDQQIPDEEYLAKFAKRTETLSRTTLFLEILLKLQHLLINTDQLLLWWDEVSVYAIDSNGYSNHSVELSKQFINGVLTGSVYTHTSDEIDPQLVLANANAYADKLLEMYVSNTLPKNSPGNRSDERIRFVRQNCREHYCLYLQKNTIQAFTLLDLYFKKPNYRLTILDLLVEVLSESQNSKLFRVYDTPFFSSLLKCLELDCSRLVLQLALTSLSMIMVHICAKLAEPPVFCKVTSILGRCLSWSKLDEYPHEARGWEIYHDSTQSTNEEIDVTSLFTFLYGLFPLNTLKFARDPDQLLADYDYHKDFSDFWDPSMITARLLEIVKHYRVDPLLITGDPKHELKNAVPRFQELGSTLEITSICMARHIIVQDTGNSSLEGLQTKVQEHQQYFEMNAEGTAAHWHRELLLIRNELAFANFTKHMSNLRALRWQKRASMQAVLQARNDSLKEKMAQLTMKSSLLENERVAAVSKAKEVIKERSAFESTVMAKDTKFKQQIADLQSQILELKTNNADLVEVNSKLLTENKQFQERTTELESDIKVAKEPPVVPNEPVTSNEQDLVHQARLQKKLDKAEFNLEQLQLEYSSTVAKLESELSKAYQEISTKMEVQPQLPQIQIKQQMHITKLKAHNEELVSRCAALERELRSKRIFEEERFSELHAAFLTPRSSHRQESVMENRFRGRGGVQGIPRTKSTTAFNQ